ncbi:MAG: hypothetical protein BA864_13410 [Desulfuromonadales bacterium C00003093]|nr:MAG: hypothetical protein BA864_13410 [Desulfuromonadales bacterium C00003093]
MHNSCPSTRPVKVIRSNFLDILINFPTFDFFKYQRVGIEGLKGVVECHYIDNSFLCQHIANGLLQRARINMLNRKRMDMICPIIAGPLAV